MAEDDWKLKLRYGKLHTDFAHYTILADGLVGDNLEDGFECRPGRAWMSMKAWATDTAEAADMIQQIGAQIGFNVDGEIEIYETDPEQPPKQGPYGYDIDFVAYDDQE